MKENYSITLTCCYDKDETQVADVYTTTTAAVSEEHAQGIATARYHDYLKENGIDSSSIGIKSTVAVIPLEVYLPVLKEKGFEILNPLPKWCKSLDLLGSTVGKAVALISLLTTIILMGLWSSNEVESKSNLKLTLLATSVVNSLTFSSLYSHLWRRR